MSGGHAIAIANRIIETGDSLRKFSCTKKNLNDDDVETIARALEVRHSLESVDVSDNGFETHGAEVWADVLRTHPSLEVFLIDRNPIGLEGARAILKAFDENEHVLRYVSFTFDEDTTETRRVLMQLEDVKYKKRGEAIARERAAHDQKLKESMRRALLFSS